ncbi:MAG TPA: metallophosphoesterase [Terriglobales bacterium]|nr:metallophosphoesterase [Terriglobales bacterium]
MSSTHTTLDRTRARTRLRHKSWRQVQTLLHARRPQPRDPQISHHQVPLPRLPEELRGLRIAHLSDIHYGLFLSRPSLERVLELTHEQRPDLIAITGDFVTQSPVFIEPVCELLAELKAPLGVYAVLGNHDFRAGAEPLTRALRRRGIKVLRNQHRLLRHGGTAFQIAGIDDSRQHPDLAAALGPTSRFTLLLAHNPLALQDAAACGVDLVLSGHTHGGQIRLGFAAPLYERFLPAGFLSLEGTQMYVSRGLGKVIVPMRVGAPPELAFLTLHPG